MVTAWVILVPRWRKNCLATKAGSSDALQIIDVKTKKAKKIPIALDGVFSAAWSPNGNDIAFAGNHNGSSDIYIYNFKSENFKKITNDIFSDSYPSWNGNSEEIAFVSDRGKHVDGKYDGRIEDHNYSQTDIYVVNIKSGKIKRVTDTPDNESYPIWANSERTLFYTSDYNGVFNLYKHALVEDQNSDSKFVNNSYAITNVLTGLQQPTISKDDNSIIFAGYSGIGWDLYSLNNPLGIAAKQIAPTQFIKTRDSEDMSVADIRDTDKIERIDLNTNSSYSKWVFAQGYDNYNHSMDTKGRNREGC